MSTKHLLDPEILPLLDAIPPGRAFTAEMLPEFRAQQSALIVLGDADAAGVTRSEITIPRVDEPDLRCLLYVLNQAADGTRPGYLHIHGGGYIIGSPEGSDASNLAIAARLNTVVLSVDYRKAPENPIPAPLEDCYAGLAWLHEHAADWQVDPQRIAIGGESAGGGLAAALAILARDRGEYAVCHQHLTYPMLDNLTGTPEQPGDPLVGEFVWTREHNQFGWQSFLGDAPATAPQVPARVEDFAGLPGTWLFTAGLDLFRDENIRYAEGLQAAGVATELQVWPGLCHAFQMVAGSAAAQRFALEHLAGLARGLKVEVAA